MPIGSLMIDLEGTELTSDEIKLLNQPLVGGIILFARNYESISQLEKLIYQIRTSRPWPILIAVDHEGGRVQRFQDGFTKLPPCSAYGKLLDKDVDKGLKAAGFGGWLSAAELLSVGIDLSFAPVLDLQTSESSIIGDRAFHSSPNLVSALARVFIEGMNQAGMQAVGKHFPGHGSLKEDSHHELPIDPRPADELMEKDIIPFAEMARQVLGGIMTAHAVFPELDSHPVTFSEFWLQKVLRTSANFRGAIFSDDLCMAGAVALYPNPVERAKAALDAGCDMLLVCNQRETVQEVLDAFGDYQNPLSEHRLMRMCGRFLLTRPELEKLPQWQDARKWLFENIEEMKA